MPLIKSFFSFFFFSQVGCDESQNLLIWSDKADALWHQSGLFPAEPEQQSDCSGSFLLICAWSESPAKAAALHLRVFLMCIWSRPQTHRRSDGLEHLILRPCLLFHNQRSPTDVLFFLHLISSFISSTSCLPTSVIRILYFEIKLM